MKILELPAYFLPHTGGIEYVIYYLSKEWVRIGHSVKVVTSSIGSSLSKEVMDGIKVKRVSAFSFMQDAIAPLLLLSLSKKDIAHIHHPHPFWIFISSVYCRLVGMPYVFHMHGREIVYQGWKNLLAKLYNYFFLDSVMKHASRIMTHTMKVVPMSTYMQKYYDKLVYIPHGIEMLPLKSSKRENFIFTVGIRDYKRLDILIKAMPDVLRMVDTKLLIAGDGPEKASLIELVDKLKLSRKVEFLGYISEEKKYELYSRAGVFVLPSPTIMESFGTVAFEAFSMKCPVIVTSGAGVSEVFDKEKIGIVIRPYNVLDLCESIISVLKNKKRAKGIGEKGYRVIKQNYQWKDISLRYLATFDDILREKHAR
ncbi:MAG: glycosyltransferase family 4 protein [Candidatus Woesearchaeota archaeon]